MDGFIRAACRMADTGELLDFIAGVIQEEPVKENPDT